MKCLLLDVKNREVKTVEANNLDDYCNLIGCRTIDLISCSIGNVRVEMVIDDEGTLVENPKISAIGIDGTPLLFGNLLVASGRVTEDGELTELTEAEIDEIKDNVAMITTFIHKEPYPVFVEMNY